MNRNPIGIFDSGIGGLSVVNKVLEEFPGEEIIYLGDAARLPYGTKSSTTVKKFAIQDTEFLLKFNPKLIIIACHTVSSIASDFLRKRFPQIYFIDVIGPSVEEAVKITKNKRIGIIGTPATIRSGRYKEDLLKRKKNLKVFSKACPLFVPLVEEGWFNHPVTYQVVKIYLEDLKKKDIDTLILGCTHYPFLKKAIKDVMGEKINLVDPTEGVIREVKDYLSRNSAFSNLKNPSVHLYFSDFNPYFKKILTYFLKNKNYKLSQVNLEG